MWRTPEELVTIGFAQSRVVMMNEFHNGYLRCVRTREIGQRVLPSAHKVGVRHLAMEALRFQFAEEANRTRNVPEVKQGYLAQPEMRALIQTALDLGWTLIPYEADFDKMPAELVQKEQKDMMSQEVTNWREEAQAKNIIHALQLLAADAKLLVWCGNGHHTKEIFHAQKIFRDDKIFPKPENEPDWTPMGYLFKEISGIDPFTIHQEVTIKPHLPENLLDACKADLEALGGTAGFLKEEIPYPSLNRFIAHNGDASVFSTNNVME